MEFITLPTETRTTAKDLPGDIQMKILRETAERKRDMATEQRVIREELDETVAAQERAFDEYAYLVGLKQGGVFIVRNQEIAEARRNFNELTEELNFLQEHIRPETPIVLEDQAQKLIRLQQQLAREQQMNLYRRGN
jgi:hypothetical protein